MSKEEIIRVLDLDGVKVPHPCGVQGRIDAKTGFGMMTLIYVTNPEDCYKAREIIAKEYPKHNYSIDTTT